MAFISDVLPNRDVRDFFLTSVARAMDPRIANLEMIILNGPPGMANPILLRWSGEFLEATAEQYRAHSLEQRRKFQREGQSCHGQARDARIAVISETEGDKKINSAILKKLTGSDEISCRKLFSDVKEFTVVCKFL